MGNKSADDDLESIENGTLPGTSNVQKIIGSLRQKLAQDNPTNTDTNINRTERVDVTTPPRAQTPLEQLGLGEGFSTPVDYELPRSLASADNPAATTPAVTTPPAPQMNVQGTPASVAMPEGTPMDGAVMSSFNAIAYVIENGEVKCASCENYYIPESEAHIKSAHCGAPECHDAREEEEMKNADGVMVASKLPEDADEGDVIRGKMIKTTDEETRLASTDDYLSAFEKSASDSTLYYRGYEDAKAGKPMDEDLAELSDDYFHGYDQFKHYHEGPQKSAPQSLYDIKPNSNNNPRMTQGEADRGPLELTDGHSFATHASNDSLKEAGPLDFAHALEQSEEVKKQQKQNMIMNMALMSPMHHELEEVNNNTCRLCDQLGHTNYHAMHESIVPQGETSKPTFNSGETAPQGPQVNPIRPVHQQIGDLLGVGKSIVTEVGKEQAKMAPKEIATEIAGAGPEDPVADIAAGGEEAWAIGKGVAKGLIKSPIKTFQVGKDIKQDAQAIKPKIKELLHIGKSVFPNDVIEKFFED